MRLNSALISTFLFVSAVLADPHREERLPPFLNRVEKSIDPTTVLLPDNEQTTAGFMWNGTNACFLFLFIVHGQGARVATGLFEVPITTSGKPGEGLTISVSINSWCSRITLVAGITVKITEASIPSYTAWGGWAPEDMQYAPDWFIISPKDRITARVDLLVNQHQGTIVLINHGPQPRVRDPIVWSATVHGHQMDCLGTPQWFVSTLTDGYIPNFKAIIFYEVTYRFPEDTIDRTPPYFSNNIQLYNIKEDHAFVTETTWYGFLTIVYFVPSQ